MDNKFILGYFGLKDVERNVYYIDICKLSNDIFDIEEAILEMSDRWYDEYFQI